MRADPPRADVASPVHDAPGYPPEPDWRVAIALRWQALGLELVGTSPAPRRKPSEVGRECQALAILAAWFECGGNITHAAARLGTTRRTCRERLVAWCRRNPDFVPAMPDADFLSRQERRRGARAKEAEI